jgi:predicted amino acid racemase
VPELLVDVDAIGANTEVVARLLKDRGVDLVAVTKGCLGEPRVAAAMLAAGAVALADTRDANLRRLRAALPDAELHRINLPPLTGSFEAGDVTYVTSWQGAEAVARSGAAGGPRRRVMLQVETGDEREGVPPDQVVELAQRIDGHPRLQLEGVSTNYACFKGAPTGVEASVATVAKVARDLRTAGLSVRRVSGGNSSALWLLAEGQELPPEVTELRCGEVLLLGHEPLHYQQLPGCRADACRIRAEVVEEYTRPSTAGPVRRLVLAAGHQDVGRGVVKFLEPDLREIGRSSDYLVVEAGAKSGRTPVGTKLEMIPEYEALVAAWMSPYVDVRLSDA